jgi:hypothetical protein
VQHGADLRESGEALPWSAPANFPRGNLPNMKEMLISLLTSMIPTAGDYRIRFSTATHDHGKMIEIELAESSTNDRNQKTIAHISIHLPR